MHITLLEVIYTCPFAMKADSSQNVTFTFITIKPNGMTSRNQINEIKYTNAHSIRYKCRAFVKGHDVWNEP